MKHSLLTFGIILLTGICQAQTQAAMNKVANEELQKANRELNNVYQQILMEYADDESFIEALKMTQLNWTKFKDSEIRMKYPKREPGYYGSIHNMCVTYYKQKLTQSRTAKLREWLDGAEEGNACEGSTRAK